VRAPSLNPEVPEVPGRFRNVELTRINQTEQE